MGQYLTTKTRDGRPGLKEQLKEYGLAGVCAYGLLNTAYYTLCFLGLAFLRRRSGVHCLAPLSQLAHFRPCWLEGEFTFVL